MPRFPLDLFGFYALWAGRHAEQGDPGLPFTPAKRQAGMGNPWILSIHFLETKVIFHHGDTESTENLQRKNYCINLLLRVLHYLRVLRASVVDYA